MQKFILILVLFISFNTYSQIKVVDTPKEEKIGEVKNMFGTYYETYKQDSLYTIMYKDLNYEHIEELKYFVMNKKSFDQLYDLIISNWENPPKDPIMIELMESYIWLDFKRALGITNLVIRHSTDKTASIFGTGAALNEKKVKKLFGK